MMMLMRAGKFSWSKAISGIVFTLILIVVPASAASFLGSSVGSLLRSDQPSQQGDSKAQTVSPTLDMFDLRVFSPVERGNEAASSRNQFRAQMKTAGVETVLNDNLVTKPILQQQLLETERARQQANVARGGAKNDDSVPLERERNLPVLNADPSNSSAGVGAVGKGSTAASLAAATPNSASPAVTNPGSPATPAVTNPGSPATPAVTNPGSPATSTTSATPAPTTTPVTDLSATNSSSLPTLSPTGTIAVTTITVMVVGAVETRVSSPFTFNSGN